MKSGQLFRNYEYLVDKADAAFHRIERSYSDCIKCKQGCSDCCHAVFGLFLIEAAYLKRHFDQLDGEEIREAMLRCNQAERDLRRLEIQLQANEEDPQLHFMILARARIRCPLLNEDDDCVLYAHRPITCRVYGIPTRIQGKARVCGKAGFEKGKSYPAFDLDGIYKELFMLSMELLSADKAAHPDPEKASLLLSVPKSISTPSDLLIHEAFE
jgi:Fe-S-cluster containining protein